MMPSLWLLTILAAATSYCWSVVFVGPGMILHPLYSRAYAALERRYGNVEENAPWWWKPLWGCFRCNVVWVTLGFFLADWYAPVWLLTIVLFIGFACVAELLILAFDKWLNN